MGSAYDWLVTALVERLKIDRDLVRPEASFREIGLDSLSQMEVLIWIAAAYDVDLDPDSLPGTIGEAADMVEELRGTLDVEENRA